MPHNHEHIHIKPGSDRRSEIYKVTLVGGAANTLLLILKFVAGILGKSQAMIADAIHSLSDFATDIVVLVFVGISSKPSDSDHRYGHGKYETIATAIIALALFFVGGGILWHGAGAIWDYAHGAVLEKPGWISLIAAVSSVIIKEATFWYTRHHARRLNSKVVEANAWHHRSDALSSIGTSIGIAGAILLGEKWRVLDPIAAILVSVFIMKVAWDLIKPCVDELVEKSLPEELQSQIVEAVGAIEGVSEPHSLRTRKIGNGASVEVHVRMNGEMTVRTSHEITKKIEQAIKDILGHETFVSVHVEPDDEADNEE